MKALPSTRHSTWYTALVPLGHSFFSPTHTTAGERGRQPG
jgi:hypothetical protein